MASKPKFDLDQLLPANPDDFLLKPKAAKAPLPEAPAVEAVKIKFSNQLPLDTWRQLHQYSFWERKDLATVLDQALLAFFAQHPDSQRELPAEEKKRRKLP
ncbi:hypothetical protein [Hymenobacter fodinae]|uniref:Uncharacterized protein n=1 Tax=Hymenobacter fodinae TaxID=2510796 RepID=A0A4Z0P0E0_9BACT|nr:hypothetical protein [Hymenobacter fodinae]TGE03856.1 hypothetical protein EU556_24940 [Hymenobacter fodinae]